MLEIFEINNQIFIKSLEPLERLLSSAYRNNRDHVLHTHVPVNWFQ